MEGQQVRGRDSLSWGWKYPLTTMWLLADLRGDQAMTMRVRILTAMIAHGKEFSTADVMLFERMTTRYLHGDQ